MYSELEIALFKIIKMASESIKQLNKLLFILDHHGVKQTHIAKWIKKNKQVQGFSQPVISRLRKESGASEKVKELLSYLEEIVEILKKNNQYYDPDTNDFISVAQKERIQDVLFPDLENASDEKNRKKALTLILWVGLPIIIFSLGYFFILNHSSKIKKVIVIAKFQPKELDGFSDIIRTDLIDDLNEEKYHIEGASYTKYGSHTRGTVNTRYFTQNSGLFTCGSWNKEDSTFTCFINLFDLDITTYDLDNNERIILNSPPEMSFSIREDALFIAKFIKGLLNTYDGTPEEALDIFEELEKKIEVSDKDMESDLWGYISFYKGNCYVMKGENEKAKTFYIKAINLLPNLQEIVDNNMAAIAITVNTLELTPDLDSLNGEESTVISDSFNEADIGMSPDLDSLNGEESTVISDSFNEADIGMSPDLDSLNGEESTVISGSFNEIDTALIDKKSALRTEDNVDVETNSPSTEIIYIDGIKAVKLNGKNWMAENLNTDVGEGCWFYDNDPKNGEKYGRLYNWEAANKACPKGWRLPTDDEFNELKQVDGYYKDLMEGEFAALLGGWRDTDNSFNDQEVAGVYWSSTPRNDSEVWYYTLRRNVSDLLRHSFGGPELGHSVRCVQNP